VAFVIVLAHGFYIVTVRQQSSAAKGVFDATLEDGAGAINVTVWTAVRDKQRAEWLVRCEYGQPLASVLTTARYRAPPLGPQQLAPSTAHNAARCRQRAKRVTEPYTTLVTTATRRAGGSVQQGLSDAMQRLNSGQPRLGGR